MFMFDIIIVIVYDIAVFYFANYIVDLRDFGLHMYSQIVVFIIRHSIQLINDYRYETRLK